ncbi:UNVERIFIED_CONTAM: hypothetical protein NCL1_35673 [Trichonephila clavipes]
MKMNSFLLLCPTIENSDAQAMACLEVPSCPLIVTGFIGISSINPLGISLGPEWQFFPTNPRREGGYAD